jgi:hypothetical protein
MRHFGAPLVETVFNFGNSGSPPSNQQLLDWLAVEFVESGWDMKRLHRLILTSNVYRMASSDPAVASNADLDTDNRLLWRMNSRRMEAEIVRDSVLTVSGQLDLQVGGPDLDPNQGLTLPRRSLYFRHANEKRVQFLSTFDSASVQECYRRSETITPQQALALSNSAIVLNESRRLAASLTKELTANGTETGEAAFVRRAFQRILLRLPSVGELSTAEAFLASQSKRLSDPAALTAIGSDQPGMLAATADPAQRAREGLVHVLLNHHEFITIR